MKKTLLAILLSALLCFPLAAQGVPSLLNYQATVTDDNGDLIAPNAAVLYDVILRIYDDATAGSLKWAEKHGAFIYRGRFSVIMGNGVQNETEPHDDLDTVFDQAERFVEISLKLPADTDYKTFKPRQKMVATATALRAKVAETVKPGAVTEAAFPPRSISGAILKDNTIASRELAPKGIVGGNIADNAIGSREIATGSIVGGNIANGTITRNNLANRSVNQWVIAEPGVANTNLFNGAVTRSKLASDMGAPYIHHTNAMKQVGDWDGRVRSGGRHTVTLNPTTHLLPTGIRGVIVKALVHKSDGAVASALVFNGHGGSLVSGGTRPYLANSVVNYQGSWEQGCVFVPVVFTSGNYQFVVDLVNSDSGSPWTGADFRVHMSVIGYY